MIAERPLDRRQLSLHQSVPPARFRISNPSDPLATLLASPAPSRLWRCRASHSQCEDRWLALAEPEPMLGAAGAPSIARALWRAATAARSTTRRSASRTTTACSCDTSSRPPPLPPLPQKARSCSPCTATRCATHTHLSQLTHLSLGCVLSPPSALHTSHLPLPRWAHPFAMASGIALPPPCPS